MEIPAKAMLILVACLNLAHAEDGGWIPFPGGPGGWEDSIPAATGRKALLALDTPAAIRLRGSIFPNPPAPGKPDASRARATAWIALFPREKETGLTIEWLGEPPRGFTRFTLPGDGGSKSTSQAGDTTITRTVIASREDDAIFIHLLAGHPGALSFRVKLDPPGGGKIAIEDRRQLIHTPPDNPSSHLWVLPFESEVTPEAGAITVQGEGEALVIWNFGDKEAISTTLTRLGGKYDPGHSPADPTRIWHGVLAKHLKSSENSP